MTAGEPMTDKKICGAKTSSGGECQSTILCRNGRCRVHGGATPRGVASPHFKHGRYSKSLPAQLGARYLEAQRDPGLHELRDEIALTDARITELLGRLGTGESGAAWLRLREVFARLIDAITEQNAVLVQARLEMIRRILAGGDDTAAWADINRMIEQRRRLVESERKYMLQAEHMLSVEEVLALTGSLLASVKANVADRDAMARIAQDFDHAMQFYDSA